ncbi:unnamed protein product [Ectocarpus sp. 4 AP-2014]
MMYTCGMSCWRNIIILLIARGMRGWLAELGFGAFLTRQDRCSGRKKRCSRLLCSRLLYTGALWCTLCLFFGYGIASVYLFMCFPEYVYVLRVDAVGVSHRSGS